MVLIVELDQEEVAEVLGLIMRKGCLLYLILREHAEDKISK